MDDKSKAKIAVLVAADNWAREIMRSGAYYLNPIEQKLLDAVLRLDRLNKEKPVKKPPKIPKPPKMPSSLYRNIIDRNEQSRIQTFKELHEEESDTLRYSDPPTVPSPPSGIKAVIEESEQEKLESFKWIGKQKL